jgi:hypothetical protein
VEGRCQVSDPDYDDRCDDEQREANISRAHSADCMAAYGVPYDPYDDGTRRTHEPCGFYLASYTRQPLCRIRRH